MSAWHLKQAVRALRHGGVVAYPTEAVWGLGCDPDNAQAVQRLLAIKERPACKGLILVATSFGQILPLLEDLSRDELALLSAGWPGPHTWLLPDPSGWVPELIKGQHSSVAVRISAHPRVRQLCDAFGGPLVSTSANRSGHPPARSLSNVRLSLGGAVDFILPGNLGGLSQPTPIRDLKSKTLYRGG